LTDTNKFQPDATQPRFCAAGRAGVKAGKSKIMVNSVATGAALACLGFEIPAAPGSAQRRRKMFRDKGNEIVANTGRAPSQGTGTSGPFKGSSSHDSFLVRRTGKKRCSPAARPWPWGPSVQGEVLRRLPDGRPPRRSWIHSPPWRRTTVLFLNPLRTKSRAHQHGYRRIVRRGEGDDWRPPGEGSA